MPSLLEALKGVFGGSEEILFLNDVLRQYREIRKVYHYDYCDEDKAALQACATDLRPFSYSFLPATGVYWGLGKMVRNPSQLGGVTRAGLVLVRLVAAAEVLRLGYLVGSYKQGIDCTQRLVSLRSALGGEVAAIIRERNPQNPLLRQEQPPTELNEDGSRPRIVCEANRLARIAHLRRELAQAKQGQEVDRANEQADERLFQMLRHREEMMGEIQQGGGAAAAASAGKVGSVRPQQPRSHSVEYEVAAAAGAAAAAGVSAVAGGGSAASVARGGGLVITDRPAAQQGAVQRALAAAAGDVGDGVAGGGGSEAGSSSEDPLADPLAMLLGGDSGVMMGGEPSEEAERQAAEEEARLRRRKQRREKWWRRKGGGHGGEDGG